MGPGQAAWEQAGLARSGVPLLTTERKSQVLAAFAQQCREVGAALVLLDPEELEPVELSWQRAVWRSRTDPLGLGVFEPRFLGAYQRANLALALGTLAELVGGMPLAKEAIREGLASAHRPGRFEVVSHRPYVVLDGAQNPAGAQALLDSLDRLPRPRGRRTLVFGVRRDKLVPQAARLGTRWELGGGLGETAQRAARGLGEEDLLVVCGPLPALEEARGVVRQAA